MLIISQNHQNDPEWDHKCSNIFFSQTDIDIDGIKISASLSSNIIRQMHSEMYLWSMLVTLFGNRVEYKLYKHSFFTFFFILYFFGPFIFKWCLDAFFFIIYYTLFIVIPFVYHTPFHFFIFFFYRDTLVHVKFCF